MVFTVYDTFQAWYPPEMLKVCPENGDSMLHYYDTNQKL